MKYFVLKTRTHLSLSEMRDLVERHLHNKIKFATFEVLNLTLEEGSILEKAREKAIKPTKNEPI